MYRFYKIIAVFVIVYSLMLNLTSCNNFTNGETSATDSKSTTETVPTETDLENGREEIMNQRAMRESLAEEDAMNGTNEDPDAYVDNSTSNNQDNENNVQKKAREINWYCSWCCLIIQKSEKPENGRCDASYKNTSEAGRSHRSKNGSTHSWNELSIVGNRKFECSYCNTIVDSKNEPDHGQCCGQDKLPAYHSWHEL